MAILNYSTSIEVEKSLAEIQKCLHEHGANAILTEYDSQGYIMGVSFKINFNGNDMGFRLPTDWRPILQVMKDQGKLLKGRNLKSWQKDYAKKMKDIEDRNQAQAMRVAWCITKDWVKDQMAILETKMVTLPQIFLPYAVTRTGKTIYEKILDGDEGIKLLN